MSYPSDWWHEFREQMPVVTRWAYFDHAAVAPLSRHVVSAFQNFLVDASENGTVNWMDWRNTLEDLRAILAQMMNAELSEIALIRNTTEGICIVAEGLPWQQGDNVVLPDGEFPSNFYPWLALEKRGVDVRRVTAIDGKLNPHDIDAACDDRTRVVAASWVDFKTGWRNDLKMLAEIAHAHDALFFADVIQGFPVLPLDVRETDIDFAAADGHKWMLGPEGAGVFFCKEEHIDRLTPKGVGWNSVKHAGNFSNPKLDLKPTASRYEGGSYNMAGLLALHASLSEFSWIGVDHLNQRLRDVSDELCEKLQSADVTVISNRSDAHWSGIVSCDIPGVSPGRFRKQMLNRHVALNHRAGYVRLSPHVYTSTEDIERLIDGIEVLRESESAG